MNFFILFSILILSLISSYSARADGLLGPNSTANISARGRQFVYNLGDTLNNNYFKFDFDYSFEKSLRNDQKVKLRFFDAYDPTNLSNIEKNSFDFPEAYYKFSVGNNIYKVGTDIYNWGVTDGFNPVDIINTKNYFDPIHSRKLGALSLGISYAQNNFDADLILIPQARSSELPGEKSRWLPREFYLTPNASVGTGSQIAKLILPSQFSYSYSRKDPNQMALINNLALRFQYHLDGLDLGFYGYDGVSTFPNIVVKANGTTEQVSPIYVIRVNSNVTLETQDYRIRMMGFSFVKSFSDWQIKGVSAWTQPVNDLVLNLPWKSESVIAFERPWGFSQSNLVSIFQFSTVKTENDSVGNDVSSISSFFKNNLMIGGKYFYGEKNNYTLFYSYDNLTVSCMLDFRYERKINDNYRFGFNFTNIKGSSESPIGYYAKNPFGEIFFNMIF